MAANRARSIMIMTGRLRLNSTHGASGTAISAPTAGPTAAGAESGQFEKAAADLSITQQAVSKRIAALERTLGVRLFTRAPRGAELTIDGQAFLPHARELLRVEERAIASVRPGHRPLRVDVIAS